MRKSVSIESFNLRFISEPQPQSQKALNLARDQRISLTIDGDTARPAGVAGLSMAARAHAVDDPTEVAKVRALLTARSPEYTGHTAKLRAFRVTPESKPGELRATRAGRVRFGKRTDG